MSNHPETSNYQEMSNEPQTSNHQDMFRYPDFDPAKCRPFKCNQCTNKHTCEHGFKTYRIPRLEELDGKSKSQFLTVHPFTIIMTKHFIHNSHEGMSSLSAFKNSIKYSNLIMLFSVCCC